MSLEEIKTEIVRCCEAFSVHELTYNTLDAKLDILLQQAEAGGIEKAARVCEDADPYNSSCLECAERIRALLPLGEDTPA